MYLNQVAKGYLVTYENERYIWNGNKFVLRTEIGDDFVIYTAERAHRELAEKLPHHPYQLKECQSDVVITRMGIDDPRWYTISKDRTTWAEVEVDLGFGDGYFLEGMGTTEQIIKINHSKLYFVDIHVRGKNIVRVVQHLCGDTWESNNVMIPIDNGAARFFRITDRLHQN